MRLPEDPEPPYQINIVPMIDVIFAILTFFIFSSLSLTHSAGLPVNLPKAATSQSQPPTQTVVTIDAQGRLALNRQSMTLDNIDAQIRALALTGQQPVVILNADEAVTHGKVIQVMDRLRAIEGVRIAIATQKP